MLSKNINFIWFLGGPKFDLMTSLWRYLANLHKFLYSFEKTIRSYLSMPNFKSISFKMAVLQGAGRICPPHVCVIQKIPCGTGLRVRTFLGHPKFSELYSKWSSVRSTGFEHYYGSSSHAEGARKRTSIGKVITRFLCPVLRPTVCSPSDHYRKSNFLLFVRLSEIATTLVTQ